ncbi:winged helix-turn-helix transcriptional regulator [Sorangium sp. So ce260]|uniref:winged helix-turn-helix transcriptional regulator n=1 Tax=Sorangium sp. So ce260 TaxID=3133291 RepID=UPI003F62EC2D
MRSYQDPCGIARALDRVGERWALLVVRELLLGPRRFTDLRAGLPSASPNVLSQRLRELEDAGVVQRRALAPPVAATVYELTPRGRELEPVLASLARWGSRAAPLPRGELSPSALMIALRTTFDPGALSRGRLAVVLDGEPFSVEIACGALSVARGEPEAPEATITTTARTLRAVVFAGREPRGVEIAGDTALATRFLGAFARPAPA